MSRYTEIDGPNAAAMAWSLVMGLREQRQRPNATSRAALREHTKRWPIPQSEINVMPSFEQNPGY